MSIMDHDPKYAKLRKWREKRRLRLSNERLHNWLKIVPRWTWDDGAMYEWKPITACSEVKP